MLLTLWINYISSERTGKDNDGFGPAGDAWYVDKVQVYDSQDYQVYNFPVEGWFDLKNTQSQMVEPDNVGSQGGIRPFGLIKECD